MDKKEWFEEWFNTSYYHTLYQHRNEDEAKQFIQTLFDFLALEKNATCLDLACGKGRHSKVIHDCGYNVLGADLSANSIEIAKDYENANLSFLVHDMREVIQGWEFDVIVNLFTSFGYFDDNSDNLKVLKSIKAMLKPKGSVVIDFLNAEKVITNLVKDETKTIDGIAFNLQRWNDENHVFKKIEFTDKGKDYSFTERVQALKLSDFEYLLSKSGFKIEHTFGNYLLEPFSSSTSDRLVIIASVE